MKSSQSPEIIVGVDWGSRRIGISICSDGKHVFPRETLAVSSIRQGTASLIRLIKTLKSTQIVFGLPRSLHGAEGVLATTVRKIAKRVADATGARVDFIDERFSTREAAHTPSSSSKALDSRSAVVILESFLHDT